MARPSSLSSPPKQRPRFLLRPFPRRRLAAMRRPLRLAAVLLTLLCLFQLVIRPALRSARHAAASRREAAILNLHAKGAIPSSHTAAAADSANNAGDVLDHPPAHNFEAAVAAAPDVPPVAAADSVDRDADAAERESDTETDRESERQREQQQKREQLLRQQHKEKERDRPPSLDDDRSVDKLDLVPVEEVEDPAHRLPPISALVLFHNEYPTMNHTLHSWQTNGLPSAVSELLFFLNGVNDTSAFHAQLPVLSTGPWPPLLRVVNSAENLPLGLAIAKMVRLARSDFVLLLEKDWALIEPQAALRSQLSVAARLLRDSTAHVVRFRHRERPGAPLHARIMHQGREKQLLQQQTNLFCYVHHWLPNPPKQYPDFIERCPATTESADPKIDAHEAVWCSKARYCQWTNNPALFSKDWFLNGLGGRFESEYNETKERNPTDANLDFEYFANWRFDLWNDKNYTVALPRGLFEHQEVGEQNLMNTVWYAWSRLSTDVSERRHALFENDRNGCEEPRNKTLVAGVPYSQKFPLEFVKLYHYDQAMQRPVDDAVRDLLADSRRLSDQIAPSGGSWRSGVTDLTNLWYTTCLYSWPTEPASMSLGFVSMLYPDTDATDNTAAPTVDDATLERFAANAHTLRNYPLVLYTDNATAQRVREVLRQRHAWPADRLTALIVIDEERDAMLQRLLGDNILDSADKVMQKSVWRERTATRSPDGKSPGRASVLLSLVTPYVLRDTVLRSRGDGSADGAEGAGDAAAKELLRSVSHFLWFDATSPCIAKARGPSGGADNALRVGNDLTLRAHMLLNTMVTTHGVSTSDALEDVLRGSSTHGRVASGFSAEGLLRETEVRQLESAGTRLRIVDGANMGGSRLALVLAVGYYDVVLRSTLHSGELGTRAEPLTIAMRNVDYTFDAIEDNSNGVQNEGSGCSLYTKTGRCA